MSNEVNQKKHCFNAAALGLMATIHEKVRYIDTADSENRAFSFSFRGCRSTDRGSAKQWVVVFVKRFSKNYISIDLRNVKHLFSGLFSSGNTLSFDARPFSGKRSDFKSMVYCLSSCPFPGSWLSSGNCLLVRPGETIYCVCL